MGWCEDQPEAWSEATALREDAASQFKTTARKINSRAKAIGTDADYDETWGKG
jgi:hypothetical protein